MQLQTADGPHMVHATFNGGLQRQCFLATQHQNHHFFGIQQCTNTDSQGIFWHLINIVIKETRVCDASVMSQGFDTSTRSQRRRRFVKCNMTVVTYTAHKQMNFSVRTDFFFILAALGVDIRGVAVEKVDVFCWNINVIEEITVHKAVVAFRMLFRQTDIFVHVEGDNVLKADLACFMHFD